MTTKMAISPYRALALRMRNGPLAKLSAEELPVRRAFEEWMREQGLPGRVGEPDPIEAELVYAGWFAAWTWLSVMPRSKT